MSENRNKPELSNAEQVALCDEYLTTFATKGWRLLIEDLVDRDSRLATDLLNSAKTEADLAKARGKHEVYTYLIGLFDAITMAKGDLEYVQTNDV